MNNSHLTKILKSFSKTELRSFEKFVNSPFYNTSLATTQLLGAIKYYYPGFSSPGFTKEKLFGAVYGKRKYNNILFNKLVSNLIKLSLEFIAVTNYTLKKYALARGLRKKGLYNLFRVNVLKSEKELERENVNEGDLIQQMHLQMEKANVDLDTDNYHGLEISQMRHIELNTLFFLERVAASYLERTNVAVTDEMRRNRITKKLNDNINYEGLYRDILNSDLYHKKRLLHFLSMILLRRTRNEDMYRSIKASLFDTPLSDIEIINLGFIYLLDFITYKIKAGDDSYLHERHLVYKKIEHDSFASGNVKIIYTFFRNFILSGINTGDFEWSKYILKKYIGEIEEKGNAGIKFYYESLIAFHEGSFKEALLAINKLDPKHMAIDKFSIFFDTRFLKFKIYFELDYTEESLAMIDSFEHYLRKDVKINKSVKPSYAGFVKYYKKLVWFRIKEDYSGLENLLQKLGKDKANEKKWLIRKVREMAGTNLKQGS